MKRECAYCLYVKEIREDRFICVDCERSYAQATWKIIYPNRDRKPSDKGNAGRKR